MRAALLRIDVEDPHGREDGERRLPDDIAAADEAACPYIGRPFVRLRGADRDQDRDCHQDAEARGRRPEWRAGDQSPHAASARTSLMRGSSNPCRRDTPDSRTTRIAAIVTTSAIARSGAACPGPP